MVRFMDTYALLCRGDLLGLVLVLVGHDSGLIVQKRSKL